MRKRRYTFLVHVEAEHPDNEKAEKYFRKLLTYTIEENYGFCKYRTKMLDLRTVRIMCFALAIVCTGGIITGLYLKDYNMLPGSIFSLCISIAVYFYLRKC